MRRVLLVSLMHFFLCLTVSSQEFQLVKKDRKITSGLNIGAGVFSRNHNPTELFGQSFSLEKALAIEYQGSVGKGKIGLGFGSELVLFRHVYDFEYEREYAHGYAHFDNFVIKAHFPLLLDVNMNKWKISLGPSVDLYLLGHFDASQGDFWGMQSLGTFKYKGWLVLPSLGYYSIVSNPLFHLRIGTQYQFNENWRVGLNANIWSNTLESYLKVGYVFQ